MKAWRRSMSIQLTWEVVVGVIGNVLFLYGGFREDWFVFGVGLFLFCVQTFRLLSGYWVSPAKDLLNLLYSELEGE